LAELKEKAIQQATAIFQERFMATFSLGIVFVLKSAFRGSG